MKVARAALHMWEEPCISGSRGSGAVFFSGCGLGCRFCQNHALSGARVGDEVSEEDLAQIFLSLQRQGAHNINLVTGSHFTPSVAEALRLAKEGGLALPVIWNSSAYELPAVLRLLEGLVDVYLPDFKFLHPETGMHCARAANYPQAAEAAVEEMVRQCPQLCFDEDGMIQKGVIVRHLLLPGHVKEAKQIVRALLARYQDNIFLSLMNQYTPMPEVAEDPLLSRKVTAREYERLLEDALRAGLKNGFFQEGETAKESFIPAFDGEGVTWQRDQ